MKLATLLITAVIGFAAVSCEPTTTYVPVYVPTEKTVEKKVYVKPKPKPVKPRTVESAEGFRAVEKPSTYSY